MSPGQTLTFFLRSILPISPGGAWKSKCCRFLSESSLLSTTSRFGKRKAPSVGSASRYLIRTVNATSCARFLTLICVSEECPALLMLGWNRKRRCRSSMASILRWSFVIFWREKNAEGKSRSQTLRCCGRSSCSLPIISAPVFLSPPSAIRWSTKDSWMTASAKAHPAPIRCRHM